MLLGAAFLYAWSRRYEIMRPETVGLHGHDGMVLGKLSGRHAFKTRMASLGYPLEGDELKNTFKRFKQVPPRRHAATPPRRRAAPCCRR